MASNSSRLAKEAKAKEARYPMFGFFTGIGAAQKAATKSTGGNSIGRRHQAVSIISGFLLALLIVAGLLVLFVTANPG